MQIHRAKKVSYCEESQGNETLFSFVVPSGEEDYQELFFPVKCRDFLGDAVYVTKYGRNIPIYGFNFKDNLDSETTMLLIQNKDKKYIDNFFNNLDKLWEIERNNGIPLTIVERVSDTEVLVFGDKLWQSKVWAISLYSFLLKCLTYPNGAEGKELSYVRQFKEDTWKKLLASLKTLLTVKSGVTGWSNEEKIDTLKLHHYSGFVSIFAQGPGKDNEYRKVFDALSSV